MTSPSSPSSVQSADVVVIGGGPGGYVAAIRAAQLGMTVTCVESDRTLGGTCVSVGCIPSKALLHSSEHYEWLRLHAAEHGIVVDGARVDLSAMMARKTDVVAQNTKGIEFLFKKNKVTWARGHGTLKPGNVVEVRAQDGTLTQWQAKSVIIATGSVPVQLPFLPFDEQRVLSNVGALALSQVPKHLIVVGGGVIGLELGSVWRRLGAKVTVVEYAPTILPGNDDDVVKEADRILRCVPTASRFWSNSRGSPAHSMRIVCWSVWVASHHWAGLMPPGWGWRLVHEGNCSWMISSAPTSPACMPLVT
jgi:dihydrolipoamide dehydrogenase